MSACSSMKGAANWGALIDRLDWTTLRGSEAAPLCGRLPAARCNAHERLVVAPPIGPVEDLPTRELSPEAPGAGLAIREIAKRFFGLLKARLSGTSTFYGKLT